MISSVIFDLDGTLTNIPSPWRYVHERLGLWQDTACGYLDEWLSGKISYEEFCICVHVIFDCPLDHRVVSQAVPDPRVSNHH